MNYYCEGCNTLWETIAKSKKGLECCPNCLGELKSAPKHFTPRKDIGDVKDQFKSKFTDKEKKRIFKDYKKHIDSIPTWYDLYPELAEEAYGKHWKSELSKMGCVIKDW
jgi:hypothetical protein